MGWHPLLSHVDDKLAGSVKMYATPSYFLPHIRKINQLFQRIFFFLHNDFIHIRLSASDSDTDEYLCVILLLLITANAEMEAHNNNHNAEAL